MELRELRDRAVEAFTKGRFARAGELYDAYCAREPKDIQARLRMGDAWARAGQKPKAIAAYQSAATAFAKEGLLARAIAAGKLILDIDPAHGGVQRMLADLYARRSAQAPRPASDASIANAVAAAAAQGLTDAAPVAPPRREPIDLPPESESPAAEAELELEDRLAGELAANANPADVSVSEAPQLVPDSAMALPPELDVALIQMPSPAAPPSSASMPDFTGFDELSLEDAPNGGQSLLHAVELAAQRGAEGRGETFEILEEDPSGSDAEGDEEEVFSLTAKVETPSRAAGLLPRIPLFSDLSPDAFVSLFDRSPLRHFDEGAPILRQGTVGDAFYVVCEGQVRVARELGGGALQELAVLKEGAFFGEMALLSGSPRSASVFSAAEGTQVLEISGAVLSELSRDYPSVAEALRTFCRQRLLSNVMATSALFTPFSRSDRRTLIQKFRAREAPRAQVIVREGEESDGLYVVLAGEVEVSRGGTVLARLREGELFGEMSLLRKAPATATVTATRRTSLLRLPRSDFDTLVLTHPQVLILVSELTDDRQRQTDALLGVAGVPGMTPNRPELLLV